MSGDRTEGQRFNPWKQFRGLIIPDAIMASQLSLGAKVCYGLLVRFAGRHGYCFPTMETIGRRLRVSARQARNYVAELVHAGYIWRERCGDHRPNRYYFLWHPSFQANDGKNSSSVTGTILPAEENHLREESELRDLDYLPARRKNRSAQAELSPPLPGEPRNTLSQAVERLLGRTPSRSALGRMLSATPTKREAEALEAIEDAERRGYSAGSRHEPRSFSWFVSVIQNYWADRQRRILPPAAAVPTAELKAWENLVDSFDTVRSGDINWDSENDEARKEVTGASDL